MAGKSPRRNRPRASREGSRWVPSADAARREIRRTKLRRYHRHRRRVFGCVLALAIAAGILLYSQVFTLVTVRGTGMSPTIESGQVVLCLRQSAVNRLAGIVTENYRRVRRGDVVVIEYADEDSGKSATLIKRAIARGGDEVGMTADGRMTVNGEAVEGSASGGDRVYPITVPGWQLFVMGDHRAVAVDSRMRAFGTVPETSVVARPLAVIWPVFAIKAVH